MEDVCEVSSSLKCIELNGNNLSIEKIRLVAHGMAKVSISFSQHEKIKMSCDFLNKKITEKESIYGVTTNFGGMAQGIIDDNYYDFLQENLIWGLKCGIGKKLPISQIRAGMVIRANSLISGISAIRIELIERLCMFLNAGMTPVVLEHGSIGASGDLVPLSYIAGAIIGFPNYKVNYLDKEIDAITALKILNLHPIKLKPKEGLALINGTSMMTGIAAECIYNMDAYFKLSLFIHAFYIQALHGEESAFDAFVHNNKPHKGQILVAKIIRGLLEGSQFLIKGEKKLTQDRYSIRCLPQFLGVIAEAIENIKKQIEIEANSATDNPLIDVSNNKILHSGNFFGQYVSVGMDHMRYYLGLLVKHLDTQIALLVTPEFSDGLPGSLNGDNENPVKFGLKGLQICANSIMPMIMHLGHSIAPLFPTHAEQYNQNINSQGFTSALISWQSIELAKQYLSIALIFAIQSIDLRCHIKYGHYDSRQYLSRDLIPLYEIMHHITRREINKKKPYIYRNNEQQLDEYLEYILDDLQSLSSKILAAVCNIEN